MELKTALNQRKSVRSYTGEPVREEQLARILTAAYEAPIGMGKYDSLHLTIITNRELLDAIDRNAAEFFGRPETHPLYGASMLIVVSSSLEGNVGSANTAAVIQNMSLAAVEEGLGSCYIYGATAAMAENRELLAKLKLPEGFFPTGSILLGETDEPYAAREIPAEHRFAQNRID